MTIKPTALDWGITAVRFWYWATCATVNRIFWRTNTLLGYHWNGCNPIDYKKRIQQGQPVHLLLHGSASAPVDLSPLIKRLDTRKCVVLVPKYNPSEGIEACYQTIAPLLKTIESPSLTVHGHSFGGQLALQAKLKHGHKIGTINLWATRTTYKNIPYNAIQAFFRRVGAFKKDMGWMDDCAKALSKGKLGDTVVNDYGSVTDWLVPKKGWDGSTLSIKGTWNAFMTKRVGHLSVIGVDPKDFTRVNKNVSE